MSNLAHQKQEMLLKKVIGNDQDFETSKSFIRREKLKKPAIFMGTGTCGLGAGAGKTLKAVKEYLVKNELDADVIEVGCIGLCSAEPLMDIQLPGFNRLSFQHVTDDKVEVLMDAVLQLEIPGDIEVLGQFSNGNNKKWEGVAFINEHPFFAPQNRLVLKNCGIVNPVSIEEYIASGGYAGYLNLLESNSPMEICDMIEKSGLRGRGGGGFPSGKKWKFAAQTIADQKYLICNADEGDPGAFMDRAVIEGDPHTLIEGMAIAAYGIGATKAYVYIRAEYPLAIQRLNIALQQAHDTGLLGKNIFNTGTDFEIKVKMAPVLLFVVKKQH